MSSSFSDSRCSMRGRQFCCAKMQRSPGAHWEVKNGRRVVRHEESQQAVTDRRLPLRAAGLAHLQPVQRLQPVALQEHSLEPRVLLQVLYAVEALVVQVQRVVQAGRHIQLVRPAVGAQPLLGHLGSRPQRRHHGSGEGWRAAAASATSAPSAGPMSAQGNGGGVPRRAQEPQLAAGAPIYDVNDRGEKVPPMLASFAAACLRAGRCSGDPSITTTRRIAPQGGLLVPVARMDSSSRARPVRALSTLPDAGNTRACGLRATWGGCALQATRGQGQRRRRRRGADAADTSRCRRAGQACRAATRVRVRRNGW